MSDTHEAKSNQGWQPVSAAPVAEPAFAPEVLVWVTFPGTERPDEVVSGYCYRSELNGHVYTRAKGITGYRNRGSDYAVVTKWRPRTGT